MNTEAIKKEYEINDKQRFNFELEGRPTVTKFEKKKELYEKEFND